MIITSKSNQKVKELLELKKGKSDLYLVSGYHQVEMAKEASLLEEIISTSFKENYSSFKQTLVSKEIIEKLSSNVTPTDIIGVVRKKKEDRENLGSKVLVLDTVQDPGNVGTLCRSALSFGYKDILLLEGCASIYNDKTISASQGAIYKLNILRCTKDECLILLKDYQLIGSALHNSKDLSSFKLNKDKFALFLGNEGQGMSKDLLEKMDINLKIEIHEIDSLNVSVAGGILMYELNRK